MHDDVVEPTPLLLRLGMDAQFMGDFFGVTFLLGIEKHLRPGDSGDKGIGIINGWSGMGIGDDPM
ncbi:hypothetical protein [Actinomyces mediterranea]|uniref:hypothetical protein n=1 Tax=Actinomyces mediterranea TaxID=1871028 RepID=UPI00101ADCF0|nr:hypothetical protein [Actinomyces mediterranea]